MSQPHYLMRDSSLSPQTSEFSDCANQHQITAGAIAVGHLQTPVELTQAYASRGSEQLVAWNAFPFRTISNIPTR
jgi:hypothetical protein